MANIELVKIEMSKSTMRMSFSDDNIEMATSENIKLTNNGNASAKFNWFYINNPNNLNPLKAFSIKPDDGII